MRKSMKASATFMALAAGLGGCAAVRSTPVNFATDHAPTGLQYSLPKGLLRIELIENGDSGLYLAVSEPFFVGDASASYMLDGSSGAFANQEYYFEVNPYTRLLTFVDSTSEGQAGLIAQRLSGAAGGAGALQEENSAATGAERVIFSRVVDPFQQGACAFGTPCNFSTASASGGASLSADLRRAALGSQNCARDEDLCESIRDNPEFFSISLQPLFQTDGATSRRASADDCERAICYRSPLPYSISLRVGNVSDRAEIVHMPNQAPAMALSVPAGLFATAEARIDLVHGMPREYEVDRNNELVAVAALPLEVVRAGFNAASEVFSLRVRYNNDRANFERSEASQGRRSLDGGAAETTAAANNPQDEADTNRALFRVDLMSAGSSTAQPGNSSGQDLQQ